MLGRDQPEAGPAARAFVEERHFSSSAYLKVLRSILDRQALAFVFVRLGSTIPYQWRVLVVLKLTIQANRPRF